jgi:1,2-diacylglycerol 3-alpha-glucosyltransferase
MKIAMFTDSYYPAIDGVVVSLTTTSKELRRRGHEVVVFAPEPINEAPKTLPDKVVWLPAYGFKRYPGYRNALYPSSIVSLVRKERPDIIHSHGISFMGIQALIASRQTKIRNLVTYHTMVTKAADFYAPPILPLSVMIRLGWVYQRNFLKRPHAVVTPTKAIRDELQSYGIRAKRWEIVPTGVDCARFSPNVSGKEIRIKHGLEGKKVILTVGRVAKEKNLELLISGFKTLAATDKDVQLLITGTGPAADEYRELVKTQGLADRVIFTGFVLDEELPSYYAATDAFAISSKFETQGIVALEAMASGKPVAAMNSHALGEVIEDGVNGYLFEDGGDSCAAALKKAVGSDDTVRKNALRTAGKYSLEKCTDELIHIYGELSGT